MFGDATPFFEAAVIGLACSKNRSRTMELSLQREIANLPTFYHL